VFVLLNVALIVLGAFVGQPKKGVSRRGTSAATRTSKSTSPKAKATPPLVAHTTAHVVVRSIDFSESRTGGSTAIDYGIVLVNQSRRLDAFNLTVNVRAIDSQGRSVATDQLPVTLIPSGGTFNLAGELLPNVSLRIARMNATAGVGQTKVGRRELPVVTGIHVTPAFPGIEVTGQLTNPYKQPLSRDAKIYAIIFNPRGRVVGSATGTTGASIEPKATVHFKIEGFLDDSSAKPLSALVSVDPCGDIDAIIGTCRIP
jgi:hypothetical protein